MQACFKNCFVLREEESSFNLLSAANNTATAIASVRYTCSIFESIAKVSRTFAKFMGQMGKGLFVLAEKLEIIAALQVLNGLSQMSKVVSKIFAAIFQGLSLSGSNTALKTICALGSIFAGSAKLLNLFKNVRWIGAASKYAFPMAIVGSVADIAYLTYDILKLKKRKKLATLVEDTLKISKDKSIYDCEPEKLYETLKALHHSDKKGISKESFQKIDQIYSDLNSAKTPEETIEAYNKALICIDNLRKRLEGYQKVQKISIASDSLSLTASSLFIGGFAFPPLLIAASVCVLGIIILSITANRVKAKIPKGQIEKLNKTLEKKELKKLLNFNIKLYRQMNSPYKKNKLYKTIRDAMPSVAA